MENKSWTIQVSLKEDGEETRADAVLDIDARRFHGWGRARRSPSDPEVPTIGEELAAARAVADLAHQLLHAAADAIGAYEGRPVEVHG